LQIKDKTMELGFRAP